MPFTNNTELTASIVGWLNNTEATALIPDFIALAEDRIGTDLKSTHTMVTTSITADAANKSLPANYRGAVTAYISTNPKQRLDFMTPDEFFAKWAATTTGKPQAFTILRNSIWFGPIPGASSAYTAELTHYAVPNIARTAGLHLIDGQDQTSYDNSPTTEGAFVGGTGHAVTDVITITGGSSVTVNAVSGGVVTEFTVNSDIDDSLTTGDTLSQTSTTGSGVDFTLTPDPDNLTNSLLTNYPGLYLWGSLVQAADYLDDQRITKWEAKYQSALAGADSEVDYTGALALQLPNII